MIAKGVFFTKTQFLQLDFLDKLDALGLQLPPLRIHPGIHVLLTARKDRERKRRQTHQAERSYRLHDSISTGVGTGYKGICFTRDK